MTKEGQRANIKDLEGAKAFLEQVLESGTGRPLTTTERLLELKPQIQALRLRKFTWDQIAALIEGASKDTIRHVIGKVSARDGQTKKKTSAQKRQTRIEKVAAPEVERGTRRIKTTDKGFVPTPSMEDV